MAHVAKYTRSSMGALCRHYERKQNDNGEYIKFGNQEIDLNRSSQNYNLATHQSLGQIDFIRKRLSEVKYMNRKDLKVMCSWVVTLPQTLSSEKEKDFFSNSYEFLETQYGKENVISAYVHKDENQPHLHFSFMPIIKDKNGQEKVLAKEVLTRAKLRKFHPELKQYLEKNLGCQVDILNGATANGNKTIDELKSEKIHDNFLIQKEKYLTLKKEIKKIEKNLLTYKEIKELSGEKTRMGALKGITFNDYESLQKSALKVNNLIRENKNLKLELDKYSKELIEANSKIFKLEKSPKIKKLELENYRLNEKFKKLENNVQKIKDLFTEKEQEKLEQILNPSRNNKHNELEL